MSTLAMPAPTVLTSPSSMECSKLPSTNFSSMPQSLPSIRQAVPEIELRTGFELSEHRLGPRTKPPTTGPGAPTTTPGYSPSNKRRRLSEDELYDSEREHSSRLDSRLDKSPPGPIQPFESEHAGLAERDTQVNPFSRLSVRGNRSPPLLNQTFESLPSPKSERRANGYSAPESRTASALNSPFSAHAWSSAMRSPPAFKPPNSTFRPTLPSLPFLSLDRRSSTEYALEASRPTTQQQSSTYASSLFNPAQSNPYVPAPFPYGYQQPRASSLSSSASHHHFPPDRTPFSNAAHHHSYMGSIPYANDMVETPEAKQRKRRGNLPKQTTDILRTWFHAHLQHPYPTEDEKQDLMRQTNLQMNQISNWFINARRRVLPTLQNQARAEEHARLSMTNERNGQSISSKTDNAHNQWDDVDARSRTSKSEPSDSDGEGSGYDDDAGRRHTW